MKRMSIALAALAATVSATPAFAGLTHTHYCNCGNSIGAGMCGSTSSTTGGTTTTSGGTTTTSGGTTTTSGGTTTSSGGTSVPEPGMVGMMGLSLVALGVARRRKTRG